MGSISRTQVHERHPDGTIMSAWVYERGNPERTLLVLPSLGEKAGRYEGLMQSLLPENTRGYLLDLRGHGLSQGRWRLSAYRADIAYWIDKLDGPFVIANGFSAGTMLEYEHQAHELRELPDVPCGMLLLSPIINGNNLLPAGMLARNLEKHFGCRIDDQKKVRDQLSHYLLGYVRVQTPTTIIIPHNDPADLIGRVRGNVRVRRVKWLHHERATRAELAAHIDILRDELGSLLQADRPIRFRAAR